MCVQPAVLRDGQKIACRKCWQCRERRVTDWVGRCIAESKTAVASSVVTLTYGGGDHERAAVLTYSDVQKFFKVLRRAGYPCKYLAAGEVGHKGRAHWHIIIYWLREPLPVVDRYGNAVGDSKKLRKLRLIKLKSDEIPGGPVAKDERLFKYGYSRESPVRCWIPHWPHGHTVWDVPDVRAIRYACKYLQKSTEDHQTYFTMSKVPLLGSEYFERRAKMFVEQGLVPQDLSYGFPEINDRKGKPVKFMLGGACAQLFLKTFVREWAANPPQKHMPYSDLIEQFLDKEATRSLEFDRIRRQVIRAYLDSRARRPEKNKAEYAKAHDSFYFGPNKSTFWSGEAYYGEAEDEITQDFNSGYLPYRALKPVDNEADEFLRSEGIFP